MRKSWHENILRLIISLNQKKKKWKEIIWTIVWKRQSESRRIWEEKNDSSDFTRKLRPRRILFHPA